MHTKKLWKATQANTKSAYVLEGNRGVDLNIINYNLKISNILSTTFFLMWHDDD